MTSRLRELSAAGFEVGCHSLTHAYLPELNEHDLRCELVQAKAQLEEILGKPVEHFSCPGGRCDARVIQAARHAGYRSLAHSRIQVNRFTADTFDLGRIAILRQTGLPAFQKTCRAEDLWIMKIRDRMREVAKQALGNSLYDRGRELLLWR